MIDSLLLPTGYIVDTKRARAISSLFFHIQRLQVVRLYPAGDNMDFAISNILEDKYQSLSSNRIAVIIL